jgi:hypothetical protein
MSALVVDGGFDAANVATASNFAAPVPPELPANPLVPPSVGAVDMVPAASLIRETSLEPLARICSRLHDAILVSTSLVVAPNPAAAATIAAACPGLRTSNFRPLNPNADATSVAALAAAAARIAAAGSGKATGAGQQSHASAVFATPEAADAVGHALGMTGAADTQGVRPIYSFTDTSTFRWAPGSPPPQVTTSILLSCVATHNAGGFLFFPMLLPPAFPKSTGGSYTGLGGGGGASTQVPSFIANLSLGSPAVNLLQQAYYALFQAQGLAPPASPHQGGTAGGTTGAAGGGGGGAGGTATSAGGGAAGVGSAGNNTAGPGAAAAGGSGVRESQYPNAGVEHGGGGVASVPPQAYTAATCRAASFVFCLPEDDRSRYRTDGAVRAAAGLLAGPLRRSVNEWQRGGDSLGGFRRPAVDTAIPHGGGPSPSSGAPTTDGSPTAAAAAAAPQQPAAHDRAARASQRLYSRLTAQVAAGSAPPMLPQLAHWVRLRPCTASPMPGVAVAPATSSAVLRAVVQEDSTVYSISDESPLCCCPSAGAAPSAVFV